MATSTIKWNEGDGNIVATYEGSGDGPISLTSDIPNEGIDREQEVTIQTTDKNKSVSVLVKQEGLREVFMASDGDFILADGGTFNVLKGETQQEGMTAVLQVNADNGQTGIDVYNYMMENSITSEYPLGGTAYNWEAKDTDNIVLSGTFEGITLNNARIIRANNYPSSGVNRLFDLIWEGQGSYHIGWLSSTGQTSCWDDD